MTRTTLTKEHLQIITELWDEKKPRMDNIQSIADNLEINPNTVVIYGKKINAKDNSLCIPHTHKRKTRDMLVDEFLASVKAE
jgi:hypothetical protein